MSTVYNRRRGASARKMRKPRLCEHIVPDYVDENGYTVGHDCIRLAPINRYCDDHQQPARSRGPQPKEEA